MKTIKEYVNYVQEEMHDPRKVAFQKTKAELFYFLLATFLTIEVGMMVLLH
jgi:hypothetical protein